MGKIIHFRPESSITAAYPELALLTIKDAATLLACNPITVRRKVESGELVGIGGGKLFRVTVASIRTYIEQQRRG